MKEATDVAVKYSVTATIRSEARASVCVFRTGDGWRPVVQPLVWLSRPAAKGHAIRLEWDEGFAVCCMQGSVYMRNILYGDIVTAAADPNNTNENTFSLSYAGGVYSFANTRRGGAANGSLTVEADDSVLIKKAYVGFCVDGSPVCAQYVYPNASFSFPVETKAGLLYRDLDKGSILQPSDVNGAFMFSLDAKRPDRYFTIDENNVWREEDYPAVRR